MNKFLCLIFVFVYSFSLNAQSCADEVKKSLKQLEVPFAFSIVTNLSLSKQFSFSLLLIKFNKNLQLPSFCRWIKYQRWRNFERGCQVSCEWHSDDLGALGIGFCKHGWNQRHCQRPCREQRFTRRQIQWAAKRDRQCCHGNMWRLVLLFIIYYDF